MSSLLASYSSLSPSSSRTDLHSTLQSIIDGLLFSLSSILHFSPLPAAPPSSVDRPDREELLKLLLLDLRTCGPKSRLAAKGTSSSTQTSSVTHYSPDASQALLALKTLGKDPSGSLYLSSAANLSSVLSFSSTFKDDSDAVSEALRTIANTLLLVANARTTFVGGGVAGGMLTAIMLEVS